MSEVGFVTVYIDKFTACLEDAITGKVVKTSVVRIKSKDFLKNFNKTSGWYISWNKIPKEYEIYGLQVEGDFSIQGLVAIYNDTDAQAAYIHWMCTAPQNNIHDNKTQKYIGVGGHLFAVAIKKSIDWGYEGCVYGFAANEELLNHYVEKLGAIPIRILHKNHFVIADESAQKIEEVYDYDWTEQEI